MSKKHSDISAGDQLGSQRTRFREVIGGILQDDIHRNELGLKAMIARLRMIDADRNHFDKEERRIAWAAANRLDRLMQSICELQQELEPDTASQDTPF